MGSPLSLVGHANGWGGGSRGPEAAPIPLKAGSYFKTKDGRSEAFCKLATKSARSWSLKGL